MRRVRPQQPICHWSLKAAYYRNGRTPMQAPGDPCSHSRLPAMVGAVSTDVLRKTSMAEAVATEPTTLKVFVSYSRKDEDFAQDLLAGLQVGGFEPYLDKHDIAAGEDWEARLGRLIEAADTVVFVISPDAVASERCAWEVECTVSLKKRLLPIVWRRVEEAQVPPRLKQLNYIFFDRPRSCIFESARSPANTVRGTRLSATLSRASS